MAGKLTTTVRLGDAPTEGYVRVIRGSKNTAYGVDRNNAIYAKNTQSKMGREIAQGLALAAVGRAERDERHEIRVLRSSIEKAANIEARRLIDFISSKLIGLEGAYAKGGFSQGALKQGMKQGMKTAPKWKPATPMGGSVEWAPLSRRWMHQRRNKAYFRKTGQPNNGRWVNQKQNEAFFLDTGQLKAQVRALRETYPQTLGGVRVRIKEYDKRRQTKNRLLLDTSRFSLAELDIDIFPNARPNLFPGLLTGQWDRIDTRAALENSDLLPGSMREKLSGPRRRGFPYRFRPMFGPVTQFWMMHRIPVAIAVAINNGTRKRDRSY